MRNNDGAMIRMTKRDFTHISLSSPLSLPQQWRVDQTICEPKQTRRQSHHDDTSQRVKDEQMDNANSPSAHHARPWQRFQVRRGGLLPTSARLQEILLVLGGCRSWHCCASIHLSVGIVLQQARRLMRLHSKCFVRPVAHVK